MKTELSDILSSLKQSLLDVEGPPLDSTLIGEPMKMDAVAIDGGASTLWSNGLDSIGVLRYGYVSYSPSFKINKLHVESEFVRIRPKETSLDLERHKRETSMIGPASSEGGMLMLDGALSRIPDNEMEGSVHGVLGSTAVVGVSKNSTLSTINGNIPDTWVPLAPSSYSAMPPERVEDMVECGNLISGAQTFYVRFHENGPTLRVDVAGGDESALRVLRHYSSYRLCPGYPFPLAEIHRIVCMDDKRESYDLMLRKEMESMGMGRIYLKGKIRREDGFGSFHSTLDSLV